MSQALQSEEVKPQALFKLEIENHLLKESL